MALIVVAPSRGTNGVRATASAEEVSLPIKAQKSIARMNQWREAARLHWSALPPLPEPQHDLKRAQARKGRMFVASCIAVCLVGNAICIRSVELSLPWMVLVLSLLWSDAIVALVCLRGVQCADPGAIQRSEERCSPVPECVRACLVESRPLPHGLENTTDPEHGSYCVRCFLWRRADEKAHHCSICQRCVSHFDHHCHMLGRCIAGKTCAEGNMGYFQVLGATGWSALAMLNSAALAAASRLLGWSLLGARAGVVIFAGGFSIAGMVFCILRLAASPVKHARLNAGTHEERRRGRDFIAPLVAEASMVG